MLLSILAIWFGYKKARDSGRNGVAWGAICGAAFIGVQLVFGLIIGVGIGVGIAAFGWSQDTFETYSILITVGALVPSIITILLIFKYLDRIPEKPANDLPPPPPTFDQPE